MWTKSSPYPKRIEDLVVQVCSHFIELHCEQFFLVLLKYNQTKAEQSFDTGRQNVVKYSEDHIMGETRKRY